MSRTSEDVTVDTAISARIRARRLIIGFNQTRLADELGVSFQQVQKYENGINRVGGSRLVAIARVLRCRVSDLVGEKEDAIPAIALDATLCDIEIAREAASLPPAQKRSVLSIIRQIKSAMAGGSALAGKAEAA